LRLLELPLANIMNAEMNSLLTVMKLSTEERQDRLRYVDFTEKDAKILKAFQPNIKKHAQRIVDQFYANITQFPELAGVIEKAGSNVERLKKTQVRYLIELFCGDYGDTYFDNQLRIGAIHKQIGLTPRWYLGGYSVYLQLINPLIIQKYWFSSRKSLALISAVNKIISIDSQLAIDTYVHALVDDVKEVSTSKHEIEEKVIRYKSVIAKVTEGDLRQKIEIVGTDDLASLGMQINTMISGLSNITTEIATVSNSVTATINTLNSSVLTQSSGASQQASAVNETTTTLEEIRITSEQTQTKAQLLGTVADNIRVEGEHGLSAVSQVIDAMHDIRDRVNSISQTILTLSEKTQQIGNINNVISNITQQTKMLALNASIEAAKAGDAGKGFAVVATEVKDLAEQSQQSTEQVQRILRDIQLATDRAVMASEQGAKGVDQGEILVQSTGDIMQKLNNVIQEAVMASQQIVAAVRQEGAGISQVAVAMKQINKVTTQFVTAAEQTKAVSIDLAGVSDKLQKTIGVYKSGS